MIRPIYLLTCLPAVALLLCLSSLSAKAQENPAQENFAPKNLGGASYANSLPLSSRSAAEYARYDSQRQETRELIRQRVQFEAQQRVLREQWYQWIGYSPSRPTVNASYMSTSTQYYYIPTRGRIVSSGPARALYW